MPLSVYIYIYYIHTQEFSAALHVASTPPDLVAMAKGLHRKHPGGAGIRLAFTPAVPVSSSPPLPSQLVVPTTILLGSQSVGRTEGRSEGPLVWNT